MKLFEKYGLLFRPVEISDSKFIVKLRTDSKLSKHISQTSSNISLQKDWISKYKKREAVGLEYYFVVLKDTVPCGTVRIYNIKPKEFEIGSWLFKNDIDVNIPILADIGIREFGIDTIKGAESIVFEVRKNNKQVVKYHKRYQPIVTGEDEQNYYFKLPFENFENNKEKILRLILS